VACVLVLTAPAARSQAAGKKKVSNQSDLPRFTDPVTGPASDMRQADDTTFNAFAAMLKADDQDTIFRGNLETKAAIKPALHAANKTNRANGPTLSAANPAGIETARFTSFHHPEASICSEQLD
jgi:hypothetical protein